MNREKVRNRFLPAGRDWAMLTCPRHQDRRKTLSAWLTNDRLLLHCFAGCSIESIASAFDLHVADLFFDSKPLSASQKLGAEAAKDKARAHGRALSQAAAEALDTERYVNALRAALAYVPEGHPAAKGKTAEFHQACDHMYQTQLQYEKLRASQKKVLAPERIAA
jgi:hypothetical protein